MDRVLLACSTEKAGGSLVEFLKAAGYLNVSIASSGSEARRLIAEGDYSLIEMCIRDRNTMLPNISDMLLIIHTSCVRWKKSLDDNKKNAMGYHDPQRLCCRC